MIRIVKLAARRVGGYSELARRLGIKHTAFYRWKQVPSKRVLPLEAIAGISRHEQRPDLYPKEGTPNAVEADAKR